MDTIIPVDPSAAADPPKRKRNSVTVQKLQWEMQRAIELRKLLDEEGETNPRLLLNTIEGETDLAEMCCLLHEETTEDEILLTGIEAKIIELKSRQSRIERSIETRRGLILMAMDRAGLDTIKGPLATLSTTPTAPKLVVDDEAVIPASFWKPGDPTLDRKALKEALDSGEAVAGARLSNGGIGLTIRKK